MLPNPTRRQLLLAGALLPCLPWAHAAEGMTAGGPLLTARHAYVGNLNHTWLAKAADQPVQIASITKLITAWTILSADLPMQAKLRIETEDAQRSEFTRSSLDVGSQWRREELLEWLLVTSDNRAAATLARTFPGGWSEFRYAMQALMTQMQLFSFDFGDPSGLSPHNRASARDLGVLLVTLAQIPYFQSIARKPRVGSRMNVNRFAHDQSVALLAGKTGFTSVAGYCLAEAERFGNQVVAMVVLNSAGKEQRAEDMNRLRRFARQAVSLPPMA